MNRPRILFVSEAVTLAHVARPVSLAKSLDSARFEVLFAAADRYGAVLRELPVPVRHIHSISQDTFLDALAHGRPLHDEPTLRAYVAEDLEMLRELQPDLVVGDLRQSLSVSARIAKVPYAALVNAYWSPYARQRFSVPAVPAVRILGVPLANAAFQLIRPLAFASHCRPMNRVKRDHGLSTTGRDLRRMYADADFVLYPETPDLVPTYGLPPNHTYIGPVLWSPAIDRPEWWTRLPADRPAIYLTPGSSGHGSLLTTCLEALAGEPVSLLVASLGAKLPAVPANAYVAPYLPGIEAARRSALVICNGGSPTSQQGLAAGVPVLGIPSNMDQHLNMGYVVRSGAGLLVRSEQASAASVRAAVQQLLYDPSYKRNAEGIQRSFQGYDCGIRFEQALDNAVQSQHHRKKSTI